MCSFEHNELTTKDEQLPHGSAWVFIGLYSSAKRGLALSLLVLGVLADDHHAAMALDDLAFFAHGFHRRSDFHSVFSYSSVGTFIFIGGALNTPTLPEGYGFTVRGAGQLALFPALSWAADCPIGRESNYFPLHVILPRLVS